jgi:multisubunit Na+/H+ antiporter MnhG subunit
MVRTCTDEKLNSFSLFKKGTVRYSFHYSLLTHFITHYITHFIRMCDKPYTSDDKSVAAAIAGLLFLLISSPIAYQLTNSLGVVETSSDGAPTIVGLVLHSAILIVLVRLLIEWKDRKMGCDDSNKTEKGKVAKSKWIASIIVGLLFIVISSPVLYVTLNSATDRFGFQDSTQEGTPTPQGLVLHSLIFALLVRLLIR